ncbi:T9SS type A sorting domain-containing protein [Flavobacterium pedocola]
MKKLYFLLLVLFASVTVKAQIITFPDANFKAKLLQASPANQIARDMYGLLIKIDANNNSEIEINEALLVFSLNINNSSINSLQGISYFTNLRGLNCDSNAINSVDLSSLVNLRDLRCAYNHLTMLNLNGLINLDRLWCNNNLLTSLDLSFAPMLNVLNCDNNQISSLSTIDLTNMQYLACAYNNLQVLDLSGLENFQSFDCSNNQLVTLNIKNGSNEGFMLFPNNPTLQSVCADASQLTTVQNLVNQYGYTNCNITENCGLNIQDFNEFLFVLYPNPVNNILNIQTKQTIEVSSISIYNQLGQLVLVVPNAQDIKTVDVSGLAAGNYFIKINSDKGTSNAKFIKQ